MDESQYPGHCPLPSHHSLVRTPLECIRQLDLDLLDGCIQLAHALVLATQFGGKLVGQHAGRGIITRPVQLGLQPGQLRLQGPDL